MNNLCGWTRLNFADIRRPALFSCVSYFLLQAFHIYGVQLRFTQMGTKVPILPWVEVVYIAVICLRATIMPLFYLGLCRSGGTICFPNQLRRDSRVAAIFLAILAASKFAELMMALTRVGRQSPALPLLAWATDVTLSLASLWMLIAFNRPRSGDSVWRAGASKLLRWFTYGALLLAVFDFAGQIFGIASLLLALETDSSIPSKIFHPNTEFFILMFFPFQRLVTSLCVFTPAYLIWRGWLRQDESKPRVTLVAEAVDAAQRLDAAWNAEPKGRYAE